MRTKQFYLAAATLVCGAAMMLTSCDKVDNPAPSTKIVTVSFEKADLGDTGYWIGDTNGTAFDNWGTPGYACTYTESVLTFNTSYTPAWASWMGYAITSNTGTSFSRADFASSQLNNVVGGAHVGKNYCVVQTYGETIDVNVDGGAVVRSFYYTNSAYAEDAMLNGDGMTEGVFGAEDWLTCTVTGTHADGTKSSVDIELAKNGSYVKEWKMADLSSLGKVTQLSFVFTGSKNNEYGLTTPAYMCVDDITLEID